MAHRHYVEELASLKVENEFIDNMQSSRTMLLTSTAFHQKGKNKTTTTITTKNDNNLWSNLC